MKSAIVLASIGFASALSMKGQVEAQADAQLSADLTAEFLNNPGGNLNWNYLGGGFQDCAVGVDGLVWVTTTGQQIQNYNPATGAWVTLPGAAVRISVDNWGRPWVSNQGGNVYVYDSGNWIMKSGICATDIGVGVSGQVWVIGCNSVYYSGGASISRLNADNSWTTIDGAAVQIDVHPDGYPFVINSMGNIYRRIRTSNSWS
jgi:Tectonin domain